MAADFRFIGTNIDTTLVTDATKGAQSFFITELNSYDSADIMAGIDYEIEPVTEGMLRQLAQDRTLALYRIDQDGECCLVQPGVRAGQFNGTSSRLTVNDIVLTDSNEYDVPIIMKFTFRMQEADIERLIQNFNMALVTTNSSTASNLRIALSAFSSTIINMEFNLIDDNGTPLQTQTRFTLVPDMCNEMEFRISDSTFGYNLEIYHNENMLNSIDGEQLEAVAQANFDFTFGALDFGSSVGQYFSGLMRDLEITTATGTVLNIPDPSTGTNSGTGGNGTPTDITSITVIT